MTQVQSLGLTPETIYTGELEVSQELPERLVLIGSLYANRITDLIRSEGEGTKDDPLVYRNVPAQVWTAGAEIELRREIFRGVLGSAQYAWQRTRVGSLLAE